MNNEDRPFARLVDFCWAACQEYGRFVWVFYGGEAAAKAAADPAYRATRGAPEKVR
ncbi:hypothetical protein [Micromonospora okii]|uniref:hypothetical protein n=1 Tax=Micromonospora okii TaxID=1182970 RepID=UPI001E385030|nr:hypothetical protein [Micromonospora okii]